MPEVEIQRTTLNRNEARWKREKGKVGRGLEWRCTESNALSYAQFSHAA